MDIAVQTSPRVRSALVYVLCALGAVVALRLLDADLQRGSLGPLEAQVGSVIEAHGSVKRRARGSLRWNGLFERDALRHRDTVRTGPDGGAVLSLGEGHTVELGADSLVALTDPERLQLDFLAGDFLLRRGGTAESVRAKDGAIDRRPVALGLAEPIDGALLATSDTDAANVTFRWDKGTAAGALLLQTAKAPKKISLTEEERAAGVTVQRLAPGSYRWTIEDSTGVTPPARRFTLRRFALPRSLAPQANANLVVFDKAPAVPFRWVPTRDAGNSQDGEMRLVIEKDGEKLISTPVAPDSGHRVLNGLPEGSLRWRLDWVVGSTTLQGTATPFQLRRETKLTLEAVPADRAVVAAGSEVLFRWTSWPETQLTGMWELWNVASPDSKNLFAAADGGVRRVMPVAGEYRWRLKLNAGNEEVSSISDRRLRVLRTDSIALAAPEADTQVLFWRDPEPLAFRWDGGAIPDGTKYRVLISSDPLFRSYVVSGNGSDETVKVSIGSGGPARPYYWRVEALDTDGHGAFGSPVRRFLYGWPPRLPAPQIAKNSLDQHFEPLRGTGSQELRWESVPDAEGYELWIRKGDDTIVRRALPPTAQTFTLPKLRDGAYSWTVRSIDPAGRKGAFAEDGRFTIDFGARLAAPEVSAEEVD